MKKRNKMIGLTAAACRPFPAIAKLYPIYLERTMTNKLLVCAAFLFISNLSQAALVANASFETPLAGSWVAFTFGGASSVNSTLFPRTGANSLLLEIPGIDNTFTGAFQNIPGLVAGQQATLGVFAATDSPVFGVAMEIRIEWLNSGGSSISQTPNFSPVPSAGYAPYELTGTVPADAVTARIVFQIQTFGGEPQPGNAGRVFLDDVSFTVIPEPSLALLAALSSPALLMRRRRHG